MDDDWSYCRTGIFLSCGKTSSRTASDTLLGSVQSIRNSETDANRHNRFSERGMKKGSPSDPREEE